MEMAYSGSQPLLDVPLLGLRGYKRGEPVDIADSHIRAQLHRQGWEYVHEDDKNDDNNDDKDGDDS